jgi:hypothetical protein
LSLVMVMVGVRVRIPVENLPSFVLSYLVFLAVLSCLCVILSCDSLAFVLFYLCLCLVLVLSFSCRLFLAFVFVLSCIFSVSNLTLIL